MTGNTSQPGTLVLSGILDSFSHIFWRKPVFFSVRYSRTSPVLFSLAWDAKYEEEQKVSYRYISVLQKICCAASSNIAGSAINSVSQNPLRGSFLNLLRNYCQEKHVRPAAAQIPRQQPFLEITTAFLLRKLSRRDMASLEHFRPSTIPGLQEKNRPLALTQGNDLYQSKSCTCPAVHLHDWLLTHRA